MIGHWLTGLRKHLAWTCAVLLATAGMSRAGDDKAELRALVAAQQKQLQELKQQMQGIAPVKAEEAGPGGAAAKPALDEDAVKKIVSGYLSENPGAGMPPSVQTGYETGRGFAIRSVNDPKY